MKPPEIGYPSGMQSRPVTRGPTPIRTVIRAVLSAATVVGVVALVLALLALGIYVVVSVDLAPQMH
jgi:hypothetical protein